MATTTVARAATAMPARKVPFPIELYRSAVGKKYVMAVTGIGLMGFVFAHMIGNLKMYFGPEDFNHYGEFLRELLVPILPRTVTLWLLRIGLIARLRAPHPRGLQPHPDEPQGPRRPATSRAGLHGRQLRQPHDALDAA